MLFALLMLYVVNVNFSCRIDFKLFFMHILGKFAWLMRWYLIYTTGIAIQMSAFFVLPPEIDLGERILILYRYTICSFWSLLRNQQDESTVYSYSPRVEHRQLSAFHYSFYFSLSNDEGLKQIFKWINKCPKETCKVLLM